MVGKVVSVGVAALQISSRVRPPKQGSGSAGLTGQLSSGTGGGGGAGRCWHLPPGASLATFLASAAAAPPPPRAEDAGEDPAARYKMAAGAHPWALSLDGASPPWFLFLLLSCLLSPSAFL